MIFSTQTVDQPWTCGREPAGRPQSQQGQHRGRSPPAAPEAASSSHNSSQESGYWTWKKTRKQNKKSQTSHWDHDHNRPSNGLVILCVQPFTSSWMNLAGFDESRHGVDAESDDGRPLGHFLFFSGCTCLSSSLETRLLDGFWLWFVLVEQLERLLSWKVLTWIKNRFFWTSIWELRPASSQGMRLRFIISLKLRSFVNDHAPKTLWQQPVTTFSRSAALPLYLFNHTEKYNFLWFTNFCYFGSKNRQLTIEGEVIINLGNFSENWHDEWSWM